MPCVPLAAGPPLTSTAACLAFASSTTYGTSGVDASIMIKRALMGYGKRLTLQAGALHPTACGMRGHCIPDTESLHSCGAVLVQDSVRRARARHWECPARLCKSQSLPCLQRLKPDQRTVGAASFLLHLKVTYHRSYPPVMPCFSSENAHCRIPRDRIGSCSMRGMPVRESSS